MSDQVGNPEDRFSHNEAHIYTRCVGKIVNKQRIVYDRIAEFTNCELFQTIRRDYVFIISLAGYINPHTPPISLIEQAMS